MLKTSNYGKSRVRLVKVERHLDHHDFKELTVHIQFTGEYDDCYTRGDNSRILATDTMKNTVYALASTQPIGAIEEFGQRLCGHFQARNPYLHSVSIDIEESLWSRLAQHAFHKSIEVRTARVTNGTIIEAGIKDLVILKTTGSAFEGYIQEEYTTLKETTDRILATAVEAAWLYAATTQCDYDATWKAVRQCLIEVFVAHPSPSVQNSLYAMGEAVLAQFPAIEEIHLSLPNKHCLPVDLRPLGLDDRNEVFLPVDEPYGLIEATLSRR